MNEILSDKNSKFNIIVELLLLVPAQFISELLIKLRTVFQ